MNRRTGMTDWEIAERARKATLVRVLLWGTMATLIIVSVPFMADRTGPVHAQTAGLAYTCSADDIGATLTRLTGCVGPVDGNRRYVTDIVMQSTTTTGAQMILRYGTGTNCGTGTTSLFPSAASAVRIGYPASTSAPTVIPFRTPLVVPTGKDLCVLATAVNTVSIQVNGYVGP